jgi:L-rhamnose mutarotase
MKTTHRYCLALDLKDDPKLIEEYRWHHQNVWPEVTESIRRAGIENLEIYLLGNRMFMILEVNDLFSWEVKRKADAENLRVQEWEQLMARFQQVLPMAKPGEKWLLMERICAVH